MTAQDSQEPNKNSASEEEESSDHPVKSGWYDDPEGSGGLRWYDAKANKWSKSVSEAAHVNLKSEEHPETSDRNNNAASQHTEEKESPDNKSNTANEQTIKDEGISNYPAIYEWESSPLFSLLGVLTNIVFFELLIGCIGLTFAAICQAVIVVLYIYIFYKSYFSENPTIKSSKAISFLNYAVSSIVFGWCWNRNLKLSKRDGRIKKGDSYIVAIILFILVACYGVWYPLSHYGTLDQNYINNFENRIYRSGSTAKTSTDQSTNAPEEFSDQTSGVSFTIPQDWKRGSIHSSEATYLNCRLLPRDKSDEEEIVFMSWDTYDALSSKAKQRIARNDYNISLYDKADAMKDAKRYFSKIDDSTAEKVTINGRQYWRVQVDGTSAKDVLRDGSTAPIRIIEYISVENGYAYCYLFMCKTSTGDTEDLTKTMSQFMNSVKYGS